MIIHNNKSVKFLSFPIRIDMTFPFFLKDCVNMSKVKFASNQEHEFIQNWKILQKAFKAAGVDKVRIHVLHFSLLKNNHWCTCQMLPNVFWIFCGDFVQVRLQKQQTHTK